MRAEPKMVTLRTGVGGEHRKAPAHLLEGGAGDLEVEAVGVVGARPYGRAQDVEEQVAVGSAREPR